MNQELIEKLEEVLTDIEMEAQTEAMVASRNL